MVPRSSGANVGLTSSEMGEISKKLRNEYLRIRAEDKGYNEEDVIAMASEDRFNDLAVKRQNHDFHLARLAEIQCAEERIRNNVFGNCISCGNPIGFPRLSQIPWAKCCTACQEKKECGNNRRREFKVLGE